MTLDFIYTWSWTRQFCSRQVSEAGISLRQDSGLIFRTPCRTHFVSRHQASLPCRSSSWTLLEHSEAEHFFHSAEAIWSTAHDNSRHRSIDEEQFCSFQNLRTSFLQVLISVPLHGPRGRCWILTAHVWETSCANRCVQSSPEHVSSHANHHFSSFLCSSIIAPWSVWYVVWSVLLSFSWSLFLWSDTRLVQSTAAKLPTVFCRCLYVSLSFYYN